MNLKTISNALHKLRCVEQKLVREFEDNTGFSLTRYEILIYLDEKEKSLQTEIAEYIGIDPAAMTRQLKILEEKGYVVRQRNKKNAREVIVSLTDFAKKELLSCKEKQNGKDCSISIPVEQEELDNLIDMLESIESKL